MRKLKLILKKIYQFHMDMDITHLWVVLILFPIFLDTISTIPLIVYKITDTVLFFIELDVLIVLLVKSFYKINKRQLVFIGLCVIIFLFNIAIFKNFSFFMSNIRSLLLNLFIPTWIMLGESRLIKKSKDFFIRLEMPLFVLIIINGIIRIYEHDLYNIWFAYYVYTNIAISLYKAIIYKKKPSYLIASFLIGFQLLSGSRAPLIYILLLAFILAFPGLKKRWKKLRRKIKIVLLLPAIVIIALCINYQAIAKSLDTALMKQGKIVRIIHIAAKGELFTSARSDLIYKPLIEDIENNIILGNGVGADRIYLCEIQNNKKCTDNEARGSYSHNLILEIVYSFGLFGIAMLLVLIVKFILSSKYDRSYFILIAFISVVPLLMSFSFLSYFYFWLFVSILFSNEVLD